jgi:hypothetical protein
MNVPLSLPDAGLTWSGDADVHEFDDGSCDLVYSGTFTISGLSRIEAGALVIFLGAKRTEGVTLEATARPSDGP